MFCPNCGNQVVDGAKFCPQCGSPLSQADTPAPYNAPSGGSHSPTPSGSPSHYDPTDYSPVEYASGSQDSSYQQASSYDAGSQNQQQAVAPYVPPAPQPSQQPYYQGQSVAVAQSSVKTFDKNVFTWVFCFLLGGLGVDRFVRGQIGIGVCKLLFGWATFGIWALVDWIIAMTKAYGQAFKSESDFTFVNGKYAR